MLNLPIPVFDSGKFDDYVFSVLGRDPLDEAEHVSTGLGYFAIGCWVNFYEDDIDKDEHDFMSVFCQSDYDDLDPIGKAGYCSFYRVSGFVSEANV